MRIGYEVIIFEAVLHLLLLPKPADKFMEPIGSTTNVMLEVKFCEIAFKLK